MFNFLKRNKDITPDEMMYKLYKRKDKRVKELEKAKYNGKATRQQEIANECINNLLDLNHELHFNARVIIYAYSLDESFKKDLISVQNFVQKNIVKENEKIEKLKKLNTINTSIVRNIEGLHEGQYFHAKLVYFYTLIQEYIKEENDVFQQVLADYDFLDYYFTSLCNYLTSLNTYYKNEYK